MYINATGYYIPTTRIPNDYFSDVNGLSSDWILQRTGINSRSRATEEETIEYMCSEAVANALPKLPYKIEDIDLIIFASYTPSDTIATVGHQIQREYNILNAKVFQLSSACSSGVNAMEIIYTFFTSQVASKALLVCADRNTSYSNDSDYMSGHLWGDGAVAFFFSNTSFNKKDAEILDITTQGLGHIGMGPQGVYLKPQNGGLQMPYGKDVFIYACSYIAQNTKNIVENNGYKLDNLTFFIGHQANMRILKNVAKQLDIKEDVILSNIQELGNTGSASSLLVYAQNIDKFQSGNLICISVFGGGYSAGSCLLRIP
ncbi:ketoacyl-ACP synthase III [Dysgonomonas sp. Marseille-P4677]|uniref:3-oxoacyl-ACP synthase III family protein n=1 Tax=Dysgonomonas sp. Marseille-P4677 TaxID=2364790 RepID=UPI001911BEA7|nr:ketoacyl-ACP synthase III [Dysgonomonas sp. Marseille-P4677]MBK5723111.1 ketoacyl-ACP synthase III [Dysgonomonas sp. Marseille-P4677]